MEAYSAVWAKVQAASMAMMISLLLGNPLGHLPSSLNFPPSKAEMPAVATKKVITSNPQQIFPSPG